MFILICSECGKKISIEDYEGHFQKDGITIFQTINDRIEIECECGNKVII